MTTAIQVLDFAPAHRDDFRRLNLAWIEQYFDVEPADRLALDQPESYILDRGGRIYFAEYQDNIAGTVALIKHGDDRYELAKMAVAEGCRGLGIGELLCRHAVAEARRLGARAVWLESNRKLLPALALYRKIGFVEVTPAVASPYQRADITMQLDF